MKLLPDNQSQDVGDNSTAIQAQRDVHVSYGMGYRDVKDICTDLFSANFPKLKEEAIAEAREHVQVYAESLMESLKSENPEVLSNRLKSPDVQFAINESVMQVAKQSSQEKSGLLKELIIGKIRTTDEEENILLDEAIDLLPKLSKNQLGFLTGIWVLRTKLIYQDHDELARTILNHLKENVPKGFNNFVLDDNNLIQGIRDVMVPQLMVQNDSLFKEKGKGLFNDLINAIQRPVNVNELERRGFLLNAKFYNVKTSKILADKIGLKEEGATMDSLERELPVVYDFLINTGIKELSSLDSVTLSDVSNTIAKIYWDILLDTRRDNL